MKNLVDITWNQFLIRLFTLLAGGLLSGGIITGIASNWLYFTKFEKLYAIQILLVAVVGLTIWLYRREITERLSLKTITAEFLVAVIIGGLFILLEQVYQTGADIWQFFALWAVLQLPLLIVLPNIVNILLWLITFNLAIACGLSDTPDIKLVNGLFYLLVANFILLVMVEFPLLRRIDPYRIIPRLLLLWLAVISVFAFFFSSLNGGIGISLTALWGLMAYFYYKNKEDKVGYTLAFCLLLYGINLLLMMMVRDTDQSYPFVTLMIAVNVSVVLFLGRQFLSWKSNNNFSLGSQRWVQVIYFLLSLLALLFSFFLICLVIQLEHWNLFLQISSIGLCVAGYFFQRVKNEIFSSACFVLGVVFTLLLESDVEWQFIALFYYFLVYALSNTLWLRTFAICGLFYHNANVLEAFSYTDDLFFLGCLAIFGFSPNMSKKQTYLFLPFGWALLFYLFAQWGIGVFNAEPLALHDKPEIHSMVDVFNVVSNGVFENGEWGLTLFKVVIVILPVVIFRLLNRNYNGYQILEESFLVCLAFYSPLLGLLSITLLFTAYHLRSRVLLSVNFLFIFLYFFHYYYELALPLQYKSMLLLVSGTVLFSLAFGIYKQEKRVEQAVRLAPKFAKKRVPITLVVVLFCSLGIANFMIIQNEEILENGTPIILKLEPKDPNSGVMRKNYLDLNYGLLEQVNEQLPNSGLAKSRVYALLTEENGIMNLCRIEKQPPKDFTGCAENIYLPIYIDEYWKLSLPSQQYFFPKEKTQYYQQAKYVEYRFKKGKVLLARLLDEHLMPL